jgi:hypothetical protein
MNPVDPVLEAKRLERAEQDRLSHIAEREAQASRLAYAPDLAAYNEHLVDDLMLIAFDERKLWLTKERFKGFRDKVVWNLNHGTKPLDQQTPEYQAQQRFKGLTALQSMFEEALDRDYPPDADRQHRVDIREINKRVADQQPIIDPVEDVRRHSSEGDRVHYTGAEYDEVVACLKRNPGSRLVWLRAGIFIWRDSKGTDHEESRLDLQKNMPLHWGAAWLKGFPSEKSIKAWAAQEERDSRHEDISDREDRFLADNDGGPGKYWFGNHA